MDNEFKSRLLELRRERNLSQVHLAEKTGLSNAAIANYELGKRIPTMSSLITLAKFFDVSIDYLVGVKDYD